MTVAQVRAIYYLTSESTADTRLMVSIYPNKDYKVQFMSEGKIFIYRISSDGSYEEFDV